MSFLPEKYKWKHLWQIIVKQEGTPESVARALAVGMFVNFFAPVGFQTVGVFLLAFLFRASKLPAFIATFVTNPYTVPLIYPVQCWLGGWILGRSFRFHELYVIFSEIAKDPTFEKFKELGPALLYPFFAGGFVLGITSAAAVYFLTIPLLSRYRRRHD